MLNFFSNIETLETGADTGQVSLGLGYTAAGASITAKFKRLTQRVRRLRPLAPSVDAGAFEILALNFERRIIPASCLTDASLGSPLSSVRCGDIRIVRKHTPQGFFPRQRRSLRLSGGPAGNRSDACDPNKDRDNIRGQGKLPSVANTHAP